MWQPTANRHTAATAQAFRILRTPNLLLCRKNQNNTVKFLPYIHGLFTEADAFVSAIKDVPEGRTLYFIAHKFVDIDFVPVNSFAPIPRGQGIKDENIKKLQYFILDIDPVNKKQIVNGKKVYRNLTAEENQTIVDAALALREELIKEGFTNIGVINSGNGAYLVFNFKGVTKNDDVFELLKRFVEILKRKYSISIAEFDTSTIKATQCFKLPGTLSTKGECTEDNPYRHAVIVEEWDATESCWDDIKTYVENEDVSDLVVTTSRGVKLNVPACMEHCRNIFPVFRGQNHDYYARIVENGIIRDLKLDSLDFASELRIYLRKVTDIYDISKFDIDDIITFLKDEAYQQEVSNLASRSYYDSSKNVINYDLCNGKEIVEITETSITTKEKPLGMFNQAATDVEQVQYITTPAKELPDLLKKVSNVNGYNLLILAVYICICFFGNYFPTPILLITGPQGTSKSTLTRFIQRIVHPQKISSLSLSAKIQDISIALSSRLLTCFDNASSVKAEVADILCSAVTKGCFQTRELFTTADERLIEYKSIIVINGIDIISRKTDLMERSVMIEMETITPEKRKTEKQVESAFLEALPKILGATFDAIQQVLAMDDIECSTLSRMADFEELATKFAIALGYTAEDFKEALTTNRQRLIDAVSFGNPVVFAVVELMRGKDRYESSFQDFYIKAFDTLKEKATPNEVSMFPKTPSALSRALGGMEENLKAFGITFSSENVGPYKEAKLTNDGTVISNKCASVDTAKLAYKKEQ